MGDLERADVSCMRKICAVSHVHSAYLGLAPVTLEVREVLTKHSGYAVASNINARSGPRVRGWLELLSQRHSTDPYGTHLTRE